VQQPETLAAQNLARVSVTLSFGVVMAEGMQSGVRRLALETTPRLAAPFPGQGLITVSAVMIKPTQASCKSHFSAILNGVKDLNCLKKCDSLLRSE
jgi:hypothetical protein